MSHQQPVEVAQLVVELPSMRSPTTARSTITDERDEHERQARQQVAQQHGRGGSRRRP